MQISGMGAMPNPAMMQQKMMARFDTDQSGGINLQEFTSMRETISARRPDAPIASGSAEELFSQIDADASGELSSSELRAFRMANRPSEGSVDGPRHRMMSRFDNDQNGELNIEEFSSMREAIMARRPNTPMASGNIEELFSLIDADASGELSLSELEAFKLSNEQSEAA